MQTACSILYCHPWPVQLNYKFTHYLIKGTIFWKKKLFNIKCVFLFSPQIFLKYFSFYEKFSEILSSVSIRLHVKYPLFLPIPSIGIQIVAWGRTDRQIWRSSQSLSQFCKRAWKHVQHTRPPVIFTPPLSPQATQPSLPFKFNIVSVYVRFLLIMFQEDTRNILLGIEDTWHTE